MESLWPIAADEPSGCILEKQVGHKGADEVCKHDFGWLQMAMPEHLGLLIFGLLVAVAVLVMLSRLFRVPYPAFLVIGGLLLSIVPALPEVELPPDLVFLIFLPPLLYTAAFFSSPVDLKANLRPIGLLSIGLVLTTACCVASVAHLALG